MKKIDEKNEALEAAMEDLRSKFGKASIVDMNEDIDFAVEAIPTGCDALDDALGCGGLPKGRIIELFGEESSGKSTLAMFFMAQVQKMGGKAALIDAEYAFSGDYAKSLGIDIQKLIVSQPETLEEAMEVVKRLSESHAVDIIVIDSVASLVPKKEVEGDEMLKDSVAEQARLMNKALRILTGIISKSNAVVIFINQTREKIGVFYGKKETTPGGKALKFYASVRIEIKKGEKIEDDKGQIGNWLKATMVKNKVGLPWRSAEFELYYEKGIDLFGAALDYSAGKGIIKRTGNTYMFGDERLGASRDSAKKYITEHADVYKKIVSKIEEAKK